MSNFLRAVFIKLIQYDIIIGLILPFILTLILTPICIYIALKFNIVDKPNERKIHTSPIAYLGGVSIFLSVIISIFIIDTQLFFQDIYLIIGLILIFFTGLLDDLTDISAITKLIIIIGVAILLYFNGITANFFKLKILNLIITIFWISLLTSAFNAIDNMDGLCSGTGAIASLMFFIVAFFQLSDAHWALYSIVIFSALSAFLFFNFHPAKIFLGDSGSFTIGYLLAVMTLIGRWSTNPVKSIIVPLLILGVPIFDLIFVILYRYLTGVTNSITESIKYSGKDHLSHRIMYVRNFGQRRAVLIIYLMGLCLGLGAVVMRFSLPNEAVLSLIQGILIFILIIFLILPSGGKIKLRRFNKKK